MKTIEETRRELFEASMIGVLIGEGYDPIDAESIICKGSDGNYSSVRIWGAWQGFNAALDAVEIELPTDPNHEFSDRASAVEACRSAITSTNLGLRIR